MSAKQRLVEFINAYEVIKGAPLFTVEGKPVEGFDPEVLSRINIEDGKQLELTLDDLRAALGLAPTDVTTSPVPMPNGHVFPMSDRIILVRSTASQLINGFILGVEGQQPAFHLTFEGKLSNQYKNDSVTVAISPDDAMTLINTIETQLAELLAWLEKQKGTEQ